MATGVKNGRLGHELLRDQARRLAELYRKVSDSKDGKYCFNLEDDVEDQIWMDCPQALSHVLAAMERFAETGSFDVQIDIKKFGVREEYASKKLQDMNRTERLDFLGNKYGMSKSVVERTVRVNPEKVAANALRAANVAEIGAQAAKDFAARKK